MSSQEILEVEKTAQQAYVNKLKQLKLKRKSEFVNGITFNGINIKLDIVTENRLADARNNAALDPTFEISNWKVSDDQFVSLSNQDILDIYTLGVTHLQNCFNIEAYHIEELKLLRDNNDTEGIRTYNLDTEWPSNV